MPVAQHKGYTLNAAHCEKKKAKKAKSNTFLAVIPFGKWDSPFTAAGKLWSCGIC
jgi:hypothetical protein